MAARNVFVDALLKAHRHRTAIQKERNMMEIRCILYQRQQLDSTYDRDVYFACLRQLSLVDLAIVSQDRMIDNLEETLETCDDDVWQRVFSARRDR